MKNKRTLLLVALAVLLITVMIGGSYAGANTTSYKMMAQKENWDAQIDKALAHSRVENTEYGFYSFDSIMITPEAFQMIYELGPEAVPYILDRVLESDENGRVESFLVEVAKENLHHRADLLTSDGKNPYTCGSPKYYAYNLRAFLKEVPDLVDDICNSDATEAEKLEQLSELGLAALPYVTARIERGETQWTPYLETQLLGLSTAERFEALKNEVTLARTGKIDSIYAYRQEVAKPVDVNQWVTANKDTLSVLKEVTG